MADIAGDNAAALNGLDLDEVEDDDLIRYPHTHTHTHTHTRTRISSRIHTHTHENDDFIRYTRTHNIYIYIYIYYICIYYMYMHVCVYRALDDQGPSRALRSQESSSWYAVHRYASGSMSPLPLY